MSLISYYLKLWKEDIIFNIAVLTYLTLELPFPIELIYLISLFYLDCRINDKSYIIACGNSHTVAMIKNKLYACGSNEYGQLGSKASMPYNQHKLRAIYCQTSSIISIGCGYAHTVVLTKNILWVNGCNKNGQLGLFDSCKSYGFTEVETYKPSNYKAVYCGDANTFVLTEKQLLCCGENFYGQLGLGNNIPCHTFTRTLSNVSASRIRSVACGKSHTLALTDDGLWGCGLNIYGQLGCNGNDYSGSNYSFIQINSFTDIISVACGGHHNLLLTKDKLYSCGANDEYQLGLGDDIQRLTFIQIKIFNDNILSISCGADSSMVVTTDGSLMACGLLNSYVRREFTKTFTKIDLSYISNDDPFIIKVIAGHHHSFIVTKYGTFSCGINTCGELAQGGVELESYTRNKYRLIEFDK